MNLPSLKKIFFEERSPSAERTAVGFSRAVNRRTRSAARLLVLSWLMAGLTAGQPADSDRPFSKTPSRVTQARRFLAARSLSASSTRAVSARRPAAVPNDQGQAQPIATWLPMGPSAVLTPYYGLVTGRVSALALDPNDSTGNHLYVGTTGGGVWVAQNAASANPSNIVFTPLTDNVANINAAIDPSISIGALSVQPGGTGVILAGTGDPNDALDSYYGAGILYSKDSGKNWVLIPATPDNAWRFSGEGIAGFAWNTFDSQRVVAAVSQAYEGTLVDAVRSGSSYQGLYYSTDAGASWSLAHITDGVGKEVQGPNDPRAGPDGNAVTSVVWNPVRRLFLAAIRFHGYYQSADGITWTRMTTQPGSGLSSAACPANMGSIGSNGCPIFRGTLAVNPQTGDTFAWTVDLNNQDRGIFQDQCAMTGGSCAGDTLAFQKKWDTSPLESSTDQGAVTVENGDYNLALAAVPSGQDTILLAGANDLWKCSLAMGCAWRNTTNAGTCMSAQVPAYQHALEWNPANPLEILIGNDSGLWRSMDAIGETGAVCDPGDASHFQNLNGTLGSLAEVIGMAQSANTPYAIMAGLGANGTAGVKLSAPATTPWPAILDGEGGPVAIGAGGSDWYANNQAGVSIHRCSQATACTPADFGTAPLIEMNVPGGDGIAMTMPAPFLVDAGSSSKLLVGTCRVWRVPTNGTGWTQANAVSPILDAPSSPGPCSGNALIRSMAAMHLANGDEVIYVGMNGAADGGAALGGHILSGVITNSGGISHAWQDLTSNPVTNDSQGLNANGLGVSSLFIDSSDSSGNTVYVTIAGIADSSARVQTVYRSVDGGASWVSLTADLPDSPANSIVVDPQDPNTVYLATDDGVFSTRQVAGCVSPSKPCWSAYGTGLPLAPVVQLNATPASASVSVLTAATYGRGIWQAPLWTSGESLTTATALPAPLIFSSQPAGTVSSAQTVTLTNTGGAALLPTLVSKSGDFHETDNCQGAILVSGAACKIDVTFAPTQTGLATGQLTIDANVTGGKIVVALSGTGGAAAAVTFTPATIDFGSVQVATTSGQLPVTATNTEASAMPFTSAITGPFNIYSNSCGGSVPSNNPCQIMIEFTPTQAGPAAGTLTFTDSEGTQTVALNGTGAALPTDALSPASLTFSGTIVGQVSAVQTVSVANNGDLGLTAIGVSVSGPFQASSNCGTQLAGKSTCVINVAFAPAQVGSQSGTLTVADALRTQTVALVGMGIQAPAFSVSPSSLTFAAQQAGQASAPQTLRVSNTGGAPMANVGFQIAGPAAASFSVATTSCGASLANGGSCAAQVVFTPAATGGNVATLVIASSTLGVTPVSVALNGTGTATTGLAASPPQLSYPPTIVNQTSSPQTVTVGDLGSVSATSLSIAVTPPFSLAQNSCGTSLAAGTNCAVQVVFTPTATGPASGTLTVSSASLTTPAFVALGGTGGPASGLEISPSSINFPTTGVGQTSSATTATITNAGTLGSLSGVAIAVTAGFQLVNNTCPSTLTAQASCTVGVVFAPAAAGNQTGSLTVTSNASALASPVALSGAGYDFTVAASGSSSQSIASGQTASYKLVLTPAAGMAGAFSLQCGTLPSYASCSFNPASETVNAGGTGNVTVTIATGQATSGAFQTKPSWQELPVLCLLLLLPAAFKRVRRIFPALMLLAIVAGISSCSGAGFTRGGGGGGGGSTSTTAPGTYSIPVTVTSGGVQHGITLTLVVD